MTQPHIGGRDAVSKPIKGSSGRGFEGWIPVLEWMGDQVAPPRVARLRALEREPPAWLTSAIGQPPKGRDKSVTHILLWRRAAVALDNYRHCRGEVASSALKLPPNDPRLASMHSAASRAVHRYRDELDRGRSRSAPARER
jgi:hypothetical protein